MTGKGRQTGTFGDELTNAAMIGLIVLFGVALIVQAGLEFIGIGEPGAASWGGMLGDAFAEYPQDVGKDGKPKADDARVRFRVE